jgi:hypothetical protein
MCTIDGQKCATQKDAEALGTIIDILVDQNVLKKNKDGKSYDFVENVERAKRDDAYDLGFRDGMFTGKMQERNRIKTALDNDILPASYGLTH